MQYNIDHATIRQQWADLRAQWRRSSAQEIMCLTMRWPNLEIGHPPASEGGGWWQPSLIRAHTIGGRWVTP